MSFNIKNLFSGFRQDWFKWVETLILAAFSIWIWKHSDFFIFDPQGNEGKQSFFWPLFGPLLISIRYGFANGVICALLVILGIASLLSVENNIDQFSLSLGVGLVLVSMIVGEFRDYWDGVNQKHDLDRDYIRQRLDSFTQNYHLLKASHDQLEQRIAGQKISLRASINQLEEIVFENTDDRFGSLCLPYLNLISEIGGLEVAGIYKVTNNKLDKSVKASLGDSHELHVNDPMFKDMIKTKKLLTPAKLGETEVHKSRYQVCIPLVDTTGVLRAILVAEKAKFFLLTPANIALLSLVSNYAADLLNENLQVPVLRPEQADLFRSYVKRATENKTHYSADTSLVAFVGLPHKYQLALHEIINDRRGAGVYWQCITKNDRSALVVLLPLTSVWGAEQYIKRIREFLIQSLDDDMTLDEESGFEVIGPKILGRDQKFIDDLINELDVNG